MQGFAWTAYAIDAEPVTSGEHVLTLHSLPLTSLFPPVFPSPRIIIHVFRFASSRNEQCARVYWLPQELTSLLVVSFLLNVAHQAACSATLVAAADHAWPQLSSSQRGRLSVLMRVAQKVSASLLDAATSLGGGQPHDDTLTNAAANVPALAVLVPQKRAKVQEGVWNRQRSCLLSLSTQTTQPRSLFG